MGARLYGSLKKLPFVIGYDLLNNIQFDGCHNRKTWMSKLNYNSEYIKDRTIQNGITVNYIDREISTFYARFLYYPINIFEINK